MRIGVLMVALAVAVGSSSALAAGKERIATAAGVQLKRWSSLVQLPDWRGGALAQKVAAGVLAAGIACTGIGCSDDEDDHEVLLTKDERRHLQYVRGLLPVQERQHITYVHVESKYRNTRQRVVYEGDVVYFVQDGGVFGGVVERHLHPDRVVVSRVYGTGIYGDNVQKRIVPIDAIRGVSFHYHDDAGLMLVLENDDNIFRRDEDDYMQRFYVRVLNVYDDGFYRAQVEYGVDALGNKIYLQDMYTLFIHKDIWPTDSIPITDHPDIGIEAMFLGEAGTRVEYVLGKVVRVYDDGFYEIEITAELDFDQNRTELRESYSMFMHESTPLRDGGFLLMRGDEQLPWR